MALGLVEDGQQARGRRAGWRPGWPGLVLHGARQPPQKGRRMAFGILLDPPTRARGRRRGMPVREMDRQMSHEYVFASAAEV